MGKLNLPPIQKTTYTAEQPSEKTKSLKTPLTDILNVLNQLEVLTEGKLVHNSNLQYLNLQVSLPSYKLPGLLNGRFLEASVSRTGLVTLYVKGEKVKPGVTFKEWVKPVMAEAVKHFAKINVKPTPAMIGEWIVLDWISELPEEKEQTAHLVTIPYSFATKVELITTLNFVLAQESVDLLKIPDPTGGIVESVILMCQEN